METNLGSLWTNGSDFWLFSPGSFARPVPASASLDISVSTLVISTLTDNLADTPFPSWANQSVIRDPDSDTGNCSEYVSSAKL